MAMLALPHGEVKREPAASTPNPRVKFSRKRVGVHAKGPFFTSTAIVFVPDVSRGVRSKRTRLLWDALAAPPSVMLPVTPTETPLAKTSAKSSAAT